MRLLTQIINQYRDQHKKLPDKIVVTPLAAAFLGLKDSLGPIWCGVVVEMRLFEEAEVVKPGSGNRLGVFLKEGEPKRLASCELS